MKKKPVVSCFAFLFAVSLMLGACNYPGTPPLPPPTAQSNPQAALSVLYPPNGSIFSLDAPVGLTVAVGSLGVTPLVVNQREFLISGTSIAPTSADGGAFYGHWTPTHPGEYYVQGKVTLGDGTVAISDPIRICVVYSLGALAGVGGYLGPCPLPTQIPDHASSGNPAIFAIAAPNQITFSADRISCPMALPTVTFIANIDDPQDLVVLVMVSYANATGNYMNARYLNWVTTRPVNQKEYRTTVEISDAFSRDTSIHWYMQAFGRSGELLQTTQDVITIQQAECSSHPLQIASPETLTTTATPEILHIVTPSSTPTQRTLYIPSPTKKPKRDHGNGNPAPTQPCNPLIKVCP